MSDKLCDQFCQDCAWHGRVNGDSDSICNYLLRTGEKRPCDPGVGCTVKIRKATKRRKKKIAEDVS